MSPEVRLIVADVAGPAGDDLAALAPEERAALGRFVREDDRRAHVAGRALLRRRVGVELSLAPPDVPLARGAHGEPVLAEWTGRHVSIAHAGELVCVALAGVRVGIDVEPLAGLPDLDALLRSYATPGERAHVVAAGAPSAAFLACWVQKEAVLKADGRGLGLDPATIDTSAEVVVLGDRRFRTVAARFGSHLLGLATAA